MPIYVTLTQTSIEAAAKMAKAAASPGKISRSVQQELHRLAAQRDESEEEAEEAGDQSGLSESPVASESPVRGVDEERETSQQVVWARALWGKKVVWASLGVRLQAPGS